MKLKKPENSNYCATVVKITSLIPLDNCDNVQATIIMGNQVIVGKDTNIEDVGLYFPVETQLSKEYLSINNLYRKKELNVNQEKSGYFEENGRIRCVKFRGHNSEGLFMPISSISEFLEKNENPFIGDEFDELNGINICKKYTIQVNKTSNKTSKIKSIKSIKKYESKLIENQFKFHTETNMLYKNLHKINPEDLIQISYKLHGTSGVSSYILCKRKLNWIEKLLLKFKVNIKTEEYDYIYSSRKVIKNEKLNLTGQHYYTQDIWGLAHESLKPFLSKGMTFYFEIVGYLPNGKMIQKDYDYGCKKGEYKIYIYRITQTNVDGKIFEFSAKQVQDFCKNNGLNAVPELYYGKTYGAALPELKEIYNEEDWKNNWLEALKKKYNEKNCFMCFNEVPEEGIVIRLENLKIEAYKLKSVRFYERETKQLDKGEVDIESEN